MDKKFYFYKTTNLVNSKYYYGSGSSQKPYYGSGTNIIRAIKKYGINNFHTECLRFFETRKEAYQFENRFLRIHKISSDPNSYNIKDSGLGGDPFTNNPNKEIIRENYRASMKKQLSDPKRRELCNAFKNLTPEEREARRKVWSDAATGKKNGRYKYNQKVEQLDKNGNLIKVWEDICTITKENKTLYHKYLVHCCKGKLKSHGGYRWRWIS
jgi:hypothetical protein